MSRRLRWLLLVPLLIAFAYVVTGSPKSRPADAPARAGAEAPRPARPPDLESKEPPAQGITVVVQLPAQGEPLTRVPGSGHGPRCPTTQVSSLLGIAVARPHGIVIQSVVADGPAAKAGIRRGDGIVKCDGKAVSCPATLLPHLDRGEKRRPVELTLKRPIPQDEGGAIAQETGGTSSSGADQSNE